MQTDSWTMVLQCEAQALESGVLQPVCTRLEILADQQVRFQLRICAALARKTTTTPSSSVDPFLPYDPRLYVADARSVAQRTPGAPAPSADGDARVRAPGKAAHAARFEASWMALAQFEALGFYNSRKDAGASQMHKHLQLIPLPLQPQAPAVPMEAYWDSGRVLPFAHVFSRLDTAGAAPTPSIPTPWSALAYTRRNAAASGSYRRLTACLLRAAGFCWCRVRANAMKTSPSTRWVLQEVFSCAMRNRGR